MTIEAVPGDRLTTAQLYEVWRVRDAVFAFEQHVEDVDVDDLDLLPDTVHLWSLGDDGRISSYLRVYPGDGCMKVGRVCTRKESRGQGLSGALLREVEARWGDGELFLGAQSYLEAWYASYGYEVCGPHFDDAGIDHVPMRRPAGG